MLYGCFPLFIRKYYYKASLGLDFGKMRYASDGGRLLFSGVRFEKLHDISGEMDKDGADVERCIITDGAAGRETIIRGSGYGEFLKVYSALQDGYTHQALETEVDNLCSEYTAVLRDSIRQRYPDVVFIDGEQDPALEWRTLGELAPESPAAKTASYMLALSEVIQKTIL